jgi:hypothetical protein
LAKQEKVSNYGVAVANLISALCAETQTKKNLKMWQQQFSL